MKTLKWMATLTISRVAPLSFVASILLTACVSASRSQPTSSNTSQLQPSSVSQTASDADRKYLYADAPTRTTYPQPWVILTNIGYESAYDETFRNPAWVAYHLSGTPQFIANPRPAGYSTDDRTSSKVAEDDYPTGYDHGHMAPNEAIAIFFGDQAQDETFFMTNMLPQLPGLNRGP